jgi:hypothetical protein
MPLLLLMAGAGYGLAHHSYTEFLREQRVSIEGTIEQISFMNPHVIITLKDTTLETYTLEWDSIGVLRAAGVEHSTLQKGQTIVATGSPRRSDARHLALLREVRRPSDGWNWAPRSSR